MATVAERSRPDVNTNRRRPEHGSKLRREITARELPHCLVTDGRVDAERPGPPPRHESLERARYALVVPGLHALTCTQPLNEPVTQIVRTRNAQDRPPDRQVLIDLARRTAILRV
jgi:hypothetical protein